MKNEAIRYLISFAVLLFLTLNLVVACTQPAPSPPSPVPPRAQPPTTTENQTPEEAPPVNEARNELQDNATAAASSPVLITYIHYKGTVYPPEPEKGFCYKRVEPNEYVVIKNLSESPVKMGGWILKNISKPSPPFTFPSHFISDPGQIIRVYTNEVYPECETWQKFGEKGPYCADSGKAWFSFYYGYGDIWSNDKPDIAVLYDARGSEISRKSYAVPSKMGVSSE